MISLICYTNVHSRLFFPTFSLSSPISFIWLVSAKLLDKASRFGFIRYKDRNTTVQYELHQFCISPYSCGNFSESTVQRVACRCRWHNNQPMNAASFGLKIN